MAYLPAFFMEIPVQSSESKGSRSPRTMLKVLQALHGLFEFARYILKRLCWKRSWIMTYDWKKYWCHPVIASQVSWDPGVKDLLCVRLGNWTLHPFQDALRQSTSSILLHNIQPGIILKNIQSSALCFKNESEVQAEKKQKSFPYIYCNSLLCCKFNSLLLLLIGFHNCNDIYRLLFCEPIHTLHFGILKKMKKSALERTRDPTLRTKSVLPDMRGQNFFQLSHRL